MESRPDIYVMTFFQGLGGGGVMGPLIMELGLSQFVQLDHLSHSFHIL